MTFARFSRKRAAITAAVVLVSLAFVMPADAQDDAPRERPATSPADAALLEAAGRRDIITHDPSTIVKEGDTYWFFGTGHGVDSFYSKDLKNWQRGPSIFPDPPKWITDVASSQKGHFWAPDIIKIGDTWHVYYSVSAFGKNTSALALATSKSLDPDSPDYGWTDRGIVFQSREGDPYNAIDPAMIRDQQGRLWMMFGSFWSGLKMIELDPETGMAKAVEPEVIHIAAKNSGVNEIEAPGIYYHDGYYYLFVNWDFCCRGVNSTYNVRVGRSKNVTGPYVDKEGQPLTDGGGTPFLTSEGPFIGPGHVGVFEEDGTYWVGVHFYDGTRDGAPHLALRELKWGEDGWPFVEGPGSPASVNTGTEQPPAR